MFRYLSTAAVPVDHQFEYWRSLLVAARSERTRPSDGNAGYYGEMVHTPPWHGVQFAHMCHDPLVCHFGWRDPDSIAIGRLRHSSVYVRHGRDSVTVMDAEAGLVLFDRDRPTISTGPNRIDITFLALPRALVAEALGADPVPRDQAVRQLSHPGPVMAALLQQLDGMIDLGARAGGTDCAAFLELARNTVMTLLAKRNPHRRLLPETYDDALLATARYLLDLYSADRDLTAERLAAMLGCSRAHLYRQFTNAGQAVAGVLREARLQRARKLLAAHPSMPVGMISAQCGYGEFSAFDRAFRARFHLTPRDFRRWAREQTAQVPLAWPDPARSRQRADDALAPPSRPPFALAPEFAATALP